EARARERDLEGELEDGAARRAGDREVGTHWIRSRLVALAAEDERLELDLDALASLVTGTDSERAEVERCHAATVARLDQAEAFASSSRRLLRDSGARAATSIPTEATMIAPAASSRPPTFSPA